MLHLKEPWKLIVDNNDLISYELTAKDLRVRIEARKDQDEEGWNIFKTYNGGRLFTYTEEYRCSTKDEAMNIILSLQKEKILSKKELQELKLLQAKRVLINIKRQFKDYNVEKWVFAVNDQNYENVVYARDADNGEVSIIMHERYKSMEKNIMQELSQILGFDSVDFDIKQEIYYYTTKSENIVKNNKYGMLFGKVEMGFDMMDEEK